jgi:hypothetical protein
MKTLTIKVETPGFGREINLYDTEKGHIHQAMYFEFNSTHPELPAFLPDGSPLPVGKWEVKEGWKERFAGMWRTLREGEGSTRGIPTHPVFIALSGQGEVKKLPPLIQHLADAIEKADCKITFGLQPEHIKLIEAELNTFGGSDVNKLKKVAAQIGWEPLTMASYYINHLLILNSHP